MGVFNKLSGKKKGVKLGKIFVPLEDLTECGVPFVSVGDTKIAALNHIQYLGEVAQIKLAEADWEALASTSKYDKNFLEGPRELRKLVVTWEWQEGLRYMVCLLDKWKLEQERLIEERYSSKTFQPNVHYFIEEAKKSGFTDDLKDALADLGDIDSLIKVFPKTLEGKVERGPFGERTAYECTLVSNIITWSLARLSNPASKDALQSLEAEFKKKEGRVHGIEPDMALFDIAINKDVAAVASLLEEIYSFTKNLHQAVSRALGEIDPKLPWYTTPWQGTYVRQFGGVEPRRPHAKDEWRWAAYVLERWGDGSATPALERLYPLLDFYEKARARRLIEQLS